MSNKHYKSIAHFGKEWETYNFFNDAKLKTFLDLQFSAYSNPLPPELLQQHDLIACDFGAGSGRWAEYLLNSCQKLYLVEPSRAANSVLKERFAGNAKVEIMHGSIGEVSIPKGSLDLAMSLGVLHHIPNTQRAISEISSSLKQGGTFLGYIYYNLENRGSIYKSIFFASNLIRLVISKLPYSLKRALVLPIVFGIYLPLSRTALLLKRMGISAEQFPLHQYSDLPLYFLKTDALDRLGTPLEQRFSKEEICAMLIESGFDAESITFSQAEPFYCFSARKLTTT